MGFRTGAYARVWKVDQRSDRAVNLQISVSKRNKQTGQYETDFSGFASVLGDAAANAKTLVRGDTIRLGDIDVGTYKKQSGEWAFSFKIYNYEYATRAPQGQIPGGNQQFQQPQQTQQTGQYQYKPPVQRPLPQGNQATPRPQYPSAPGTTGYNGYQSQQPPVDELSEGYSDEGFPF